MPRRDSCALREIAHKGADLARRPFGLPPQHLEGQHNERIASEQRHRDTEEAMQRRPAASQVQIIEAGQIVMSKRSRVDQLD